MYQIQVPACLNYFLLFPPGTGLIQYGMLIICQGIFSSAWLNHIQHGHFFQGHIIQTTSIHEGIGIRDFIFRSLILELICQIQRKHVKVWIARNSYKTYGSYNQVYTVILFFSNFNYIIYTVFNKHANQPYKNQEKMEKISKLETMK